MKDLNQAKSIVELMEDSISNLKNVLNVDNVVAKPVKTENGDTIFPIVKLTVGYVAGGGEYCGKKVRKTNLPFAGGASSGFSATPVGFLVVRKNSCEMITLENENAFAEIAKNLSTSLSDFVKNKGKQGLEKVKNEVKKSKNAKKGDKNA